MTERVWGKHVQGSLSPPPGRRSPKDALKTLISSYKREGLGQECGCAYERRSLGARSLRAAPSRDGSTQTAPGLLHGGPLCPGNMVQPPTDRPERSHMGFEPGARLHMHSGLPRG